MGATAEQVQTSYDGGNEFFRLWLDEGMSYTGAMFEGDEPLEAGARLERVEGLRGDVDVRPERHPVCLVAAEQEVPAAAEVVGDAWGVRRAEIRQGDAGREGSAHLGIAGRGARHHEERASEGDRRRDREGVSAASRARHFPPAQTG